MELQKISKNDAFIIQKNILSGQFEKQTLSSKSNNQLQGKSVETSINANYSYQHLLMEYSSDHGDKVSISYEAIEFSESMQQLQTETDPKKIKELAKYIKDEFKTLKKELITINVGDKNTVNTDKSQDVQKNKIPEYWGAEQTSQRIVDFATSFYGTVGQKGEEYLKTIKAAIEDGFKQAKEILGDLPEETESLIKDTYSMVMSKLDNWAKDKNVTLSQTEA